MNPLKRLSLYLWILLSSLPPVSWGRLLMPAVFAGSWTGLVTLKIDPATAFVWSAVLGQAAHFYAVIPVSAGWQRRLFGRARTTMWCAVVFYFGLFALQIWLASPVLTQRLVTVWCAFYVLVNVLGLLGDKVALNWQAPVHDDSDVPLEFRHHILKLYALTAFLVIAVNESLLVADAPLGTRVAILSTLPIFLHYNFEIMLRLTCPRLDQNSG